MTTYKEYINPEVEFKVRQRGKKNKKQSIKKQSIKGGPVTEDIIKYGKRKRRSVRPEPLDKFTIRKSNHRPLTVKEKTDPRRIKKLKRKKYDLKYSPGPGKATLEKRYQEPLDKHFLREQGPGAPPIPSPQDPKHFKEIPPRFAGGGKALRGLGRAFVKKGGKV